MKAVVKAVCRPFRRGPKDGMPSRPATKQYCRQTEGEDAWGFAATKKYCGCVAWGQIMEECHPDQPQRSFA